MLAKFDGAKLRKVRGTQRITQVELAVRAGTSIRYVRALEKGRKRNPSGELLCKLAIALDVPMETFMQVQPEENDDFYFEREEKRDYYEAPEIMRRW